MNIAYNMDCMEGMKPYPDKYFDLAVVDPPYGLPKSSSNGRGKLKNRAFNCGHISTWDKAPDQTYFDQLFRVSKNQIIFGGNYFALPPCRGFIVWDKMNPWENFSRCEYAWTSFNFPSKLFQFDNRSGGKIHPTQKPVRLLRKLIQTFTDPGDVVIDPVAGSGTTLRAALETGRSAYGFEIDKAFYKAAREEMLAPALHPAQVSFDEMGAGL